jgi:hypothetical protein
MIATRARILVPALFIGAGLAATDAPGQAQDVQYETVTKTELPGALGTAARVAARLGGGSMEVVERTSIKDKRMRVDSDGSSTIVDLEDGRMTFLDHNAKTYTSFTFAEMVQRAEAGIRQVSEAREERTVSGADDAAARMQFSYSVDDARQRERVAGYDAQRFFLTMQAETEYVPEDGTDFEEGGTLVVFTDLWSSKDVPVLAARSAFDESSAQEFAAAGAALTEGIAAAFADDPQLRVAFEQSAEELRKIEGMAVRTIMHFVVVAPGQRFDRTAITDPQPGPGVARQAARAGLGRLAARAAGARQQEQPQQEAEPTQAVMLTVTSEVRNISTASVDAKLFEVPDGYREVRVDG